METIFIMIKIKMKYEIKV